MLGDHESGKSNYRKNIVEPYENDRFFKMEKNLWIFFLLEPKKLLECIKEVQKKAAVLGCSSFKAMNITMPKPIWKFPQETKTSYLQFNFISEIPLNPEAHVTEPPSIIWSEKIFLFNPEEPQW